MKLLAGQSFPTKGEIEILGKHGQKDLENVRKQMGCMIEQPGFFPNMTVEQTLKYYCIQKGIPDKGRILEMMKMTGIYEKRKSKCGTLSLGQKQRLGLGIAMLGEPKILPSQIQRATVFSWKRPFRKKTIRFCLRKG